MNTAQTTSTEMTTVAVTALQAELDAIKRKDLARLGDGTIFWITEAGQKKRGFKARVNLDHPTHFCFPGGPQAKPMITGEGFDRINQYAGIEVFRPRTLIAGDGKEVGNPYFERDRNGAMVAVTIRGIGTGYAPTGNLCFVDKTIYLHLQTLLVQEIQAKLKKFPSLGMLGSADKRPDEIVYYGDNGQRGHKRVINPEPTVVKAVGAWHFINFTESVGYWVNMSHPIVMEAFESYAQKQRFLERSADTILRRLILSSHPAIATKTPVITELTPGEYGKVASAKGYVIVFGFKHEAGGAEQRRSDLGAMAERVAAGERVANAEVIQGVHDGAEDVEVVGAEDADPSEIQPGAADDDTDEDYQPPAPTATVPPVEDQPKAPQQKAGDRLNALCIAAGKDPSIQAKFSAARKAGGFATLAALRAAPDAAVHAFCDAVEGVAR